VADDSGKLSDPDDLLASATEALNRYSKARPLEVVTDLLGSDSHDVELPIDWIDGFSAVLQVEFPTGRVPANVIDRRDYSIYAGPAGKKLRILIAQPDVDESVRVTYTLLHSEDSVPAGDLEAVANLAASVCCLVLAAKYGNTSDPTIQADVVNYRSKIDEYRRLAQHYEGLYNAYLGIKDDDTVPAAMATALPPESDRVRLTHRRR
jgi:hypothetical protein